MFKRLLQWHERHHPCRLCLSFLQRLHLSTDFCRQLVCNLYLGVSLTIVLLILPLHNIHLLATIEDTAIDWIINTRLHTALSKQETPHFIFIDIDESTYQAWGEPLITPRDKLKQLIEFAANGQPRVIIVDIDVTYPTQCITERTQCLNAKTPLENADATLRDFLATYCNNSKPCPYLILVKMTRPLLNEHGHPMPERQLRPSFLDSDSDIDKNGHIYWASTLFELSDNQLRRWRLCEPVKTNQFAHLPSVQLLVDELLSNSTELATAIDERCTKNTQTALSQRILYTFLPSSEQKPYPQVTVPGKNKQHPLLTTYSAAQLLEQQEIDNSALQQSIVIIGSSYSDNNDRYTTPLGTMPGALVIANAIHSLQQYGALHKPHWLSALLIEIVSIIVMSLLFTRFNSFYGMLFSTLFVIIAIIPLSFLLFEYGQWLDFVIPLLAVQLHRMAAVLHHHPQGD